MATKKATVKDAKVSGTKKATAKKTTVKKTTTKKTTTKKPAAKKAAPKVPTIIQEENNYGKTLLSGLLIILILIGGFFAYKHFIGNLKNGNVTADEKRFKEDYEKLNNTTRKSGMKLRTMDVMKDNNIKYITIEEAAEKINKGSGVIYFGFAGCPWCRNAVPSLLQAMSSTDLEEIYYVDIRPVADDENTDIRSIWKVNARNKAEKDKSHTVSESYYNILTDLAGWLSDYEIKTDNGKIINTGEKRLYAPTVVAVSNGTVVGFHEGTLKGHDIKDGNLPDLTKEQEEELTKIYVDMINKYLGSNCSMDGEGC